MQMKKILIVGAGFLQDFVIRRAKELGYYTIAIDGNPEAVGLKHADKGAAINIVDVDACYEFAKNESIDGVLTAATDFGVLSTSYIAEKMGLPGLKYEAAKRIKNKYTVRKRLIDANVDDTHEAFEVDSVTNLEKISVHYPVMVKPCDGSGSRATSRVDTFENLKNACNLAISSSLVHKALVESFIFGKEYGAESIVINGKVHVLTIMKKRMTAPPYYAEIGHQIPNELPLEVESKAKTCVEKAIKALEINHGAVNMDLIINESGDIHIVDVGARMGGNLIGSHIVPYGTGIDYIKVLIRSSLGEHVDLTPSIYTAVATRLLAFPEGDINFLPNISQLEKEQNVEIYHHMSIGMHVNEYHTNLDGCGYIVARAEKGSEATNKVECVYRQLYRACFGG